MKKILITSALCLTLIAPAFAFAQVAPETITQESLLQQLNNLYAQLTIELAKQLGETNHRLEQQTALIEALKAPAVTTSSAPALGAVVSQPACGTIYTSINALSSNPDGSDAAVAALRAETEKARIPAMCSNKPNRDTNKTVDRFCSQEGL